MLLPPSSLLPALASLAAVVALVLLAARLLRNTSYARPRATARLAVQETLPLDRARRLLLIRADGRDLLVLTGTQQDLVLGWLPPQDPTP